MHQQPTPSTFPSMPAPNMLGRRFAMMMMPGQVPDHVFGGTEKFDGRGQARRKNIKEGVSTYLLSGSFLVKELLCYKTCQFMLHWPVSFR